jgi:arabinofuranosyltransferase
MMEGRKQTVVGWFIALVALLAAGGYLLSSYSHGLLSFPLDDAWIHQTYARNLAETGRLAYLPGQPSAGSTSPAWSFLLSVSYLAGLDYRLWAYVLGALSLAAVALLAYRLVLHLVSTWSQAGHVSRVGVALSAGLLCAVEWHLVWASVSGMETMLFTALSLALLVALFDQVASLRSPEDPVTLQKERAVVRAVGIGLLGGMLVLTRPEGLGLVGLVIVALILLPRPPVRGEVRGRLLTAGAATLALGALLVPYVAFNLRTAGSVFPNTLYAKQAEYRVLLQALSLPARFWRVVGSTLVGGQAVLVPGFCYAAYRLIRQRRWLALLPLVWWLAFLSAYALRLPVTYQHARYAMPSIPVLIAYGVWGTADLLRPRSPHLALRVLSRAMPVATGVLALLFLWRGSMAYLDDVGFIEREMVATARWLNEQTTPGDVLAVHDIGAVGYLTDRPLLDLAGLIDPGVIPVIDDAGQLALWMSQRGATYAVFFPDFSPAYAQLAVDPRFQEVYCTDYAWTQSAGHENMCIYRLNHGEGP